EDGIRDLTVTGVQTCALPICARSSDPFLPVWPGNLKEPRRGTSVIARAGEGNRTLTTSLEGWSSTIELRPHRTSCTCRNRHVGRSEEHTSELQSQSNLVCRLL